jgi:SAM-dependent methyltransferase
VTTSPEALHLSGERTVPGVPEENYWFRRHEAAYHAMLPYCDGAMVLEAGAGEGYGADLIAGRARRVLALDYDEATTAHVARHYRGLWTIRANLAVLPLRSSTVDVVTCFQVLEHLWDQAGFLVECRRVLRPGGRLVVTTPNRLTFTPGSDTPLNPYHTRELAPSELDDLLRAAGFDIEVGHGLHHGPRLRVLDERHGGSIIGAQLDVVLGSLPGQATWPAGLLADVAAIAADDFEIHGEDRDTSLDLVSVAVRR